MKHASPQLALQKIEYQYKFLAPLAMLYIMVALADILSVYRLVQFGSIVVSAGVFLMPVYYLIEDMLTEIYGYKRSRQILWTGLAWGFLFALIFKMVNSFPAPSFWHNQEDYVVVTTHLLRTMIGGGCIAVVIGAFINTYAIAKWKILCAGKYFWLRSLGSSAIGQAIQVALGCLLLYVGVYPIETIIKMILPIYLIQIILSTIIVIPGTFITYWIKSREGMEVYDYNTNFSPFKISVEQEEVFKVKQ